MKSLLKILGFGALAVGLLTLPGVWALDRAAGRDLLIVEAQPEVVEFSRGLWELNGGAKEEVPGIYGTPRGIERLVFVPEEKILVPREDPGVTLYLKSGDDHPLQAQTLWYFGVPTAIGAVLVGGILLLIARRRQ